MASDLAVATDPALVERVPDAGEFVLAACEQAKAFLQQALEQDDIEKIAEVRSQADAVRVYTTQNSSARTPSWRLPRSSVAPSGGLRW